MRIENVTGDGTWNTLAVPPDNREYALHIQNSDSVAVSVRYENNPSEVWTVKADKVGVFGVAPMQSDQIAVNAASGTIQARYVAF